MAQRPQSDRLVAQLMRAAQGPGLRVRPTGAAHWLAHGPAHGPGPWPGPWVRLMDPAGGPAMARSIGRAPWTVTLRPLTHQGFRKHMNIYLMQILLSYLIIPINELIKIEFNNLMIIKI